MFKYNKIFIAVAFLFASVTNAQSVTTGTLTVDVVNGDQAVVAATVSVENTGTGLTRSATSNDSGSARVGSLPPGNYTVTVTASGFAANSADVTITTGVNSYTANMAMMVAGVDVEDLVTTASFVKANAYEVNETGLNINVTELATQIPVGEDLTSLTLLAPGAVEGDAAFGFLPSFGGSSVGENQYLINGLNTTNFRNFIGYSDVPFEFYETVDVKTGGFQAQYGKAIGGFVTATTKRGSNDFKVSFKASIAPDSMRDKQPNTYASANQLNEVDNTTYSVSVSGPIIEDKLFYYVLAAPTVTKSKSYGIEVGSQDNYELDETFMGAKIDYYLNDNNLLELTYFTDEGTGVTDSYQWDAATEVTGTYLGPSFSNFGGDNMIVSFSSVLTDSLTLDILHGTNEYERTNSSSTANLPPIYDNRGSCSFCYRSGAAAFYTSVGSDEREQSNISVTYAVGNHVVKVGYEEEELTASENRILSGGKYILLADVTYPNCGATTSTYCARVRTYSVGGEFGVQNDAWYIQDSWDVSDRLNLNIGLRNSSFSNQDANGDTFIDAADQKAYRIGATYDLTGEGTDKLSVFFGKYFLPVAANTNIRLAGGENYIHTYHNLLNDIPIGTSILTEGDIQIGPAHTTVIVGDGTVPATYAAKAGNIDPMYQDEIILGYSKFLDSGWSLGAFFTYRNLASAVDDILVDHAVRAYCEDAGIADVTNAAGDTCADIWYGPHSYVLANPGVDITWTTDELPGTDGVPTTINLKAGDLAFPEVKREYTALDLTFDKAWDGEWFLGGSVTLSSNRGNYEGTVKSDNGQDDAGLTQDYDFPEFMDNAYGYLPNHRAVKAKMYGAAYVGNTLVGLNLRMASPRKYGCIGTYPGGTTADDNFGGAFYYGGNNSWACNGVPTPRGESFDGKWQNQVDLSLSRDISIPGLSKANVMVNIFNIFDFESPEDYNEYGEADGTYPDPDWQQPTRYQPGRSVRINISGEF
ncbi:MAG: hypothetical protein CMD80_01245 [Gammaproteobacteria bacterium]|nr:hypothetical protein [Gammaproteobacteria bacterium]